MVETLPVVVEGALLVLVVPLPMVVEEGAALLVVEESEDAEVDGMTSPPEMILTE